MLEWLAPTAAVAIAPWIFWGAVEIARSGWVAIPAADDWVRRFIRWYGTGRVAGVAETGFLPPTARYPGATWNGYVDGPARPITAYAVENDGRTLCVINSQQLKHSTSH